MPTLTVPYYGISVLGICIPSRRRDTIQKVSIVKYLIALVNTFVAKFILFFTILTDKGTLFLSCQLTVQASYYGITVLGICIPSRRRDGIQKVSIVKYLLALVNTFVAKFILFLPF